MGAMNIDLSAPVVYQGEELVDIVWQVPPGPDQPGVPHVDDDGEIRRQAVTIGHLLRDVVRMKTSENPLLMPRVDKVRIAQLDPRLAGESIELTDEEAAWIVERAVTYSTPLALGTVAEVLGVELSAAEPV